MLRRVRSGIHVCVVSDARGTLQGAHVTDGNHARRTAHHGILDRTLIGPTVDVAAEPQLRSRTDAESPIVNPVREPGALADAVRIAFTIKTDSAQRLVKVGLPGRLGE